jgi:hypothetical protein
MQNIGNDAYDIALPATGGRGRNPVPRPPVPASATRFEAELGGAGGAKLPTEAGQFATQQSKKVRALGTPISRTLPEWLKELPERDMAPDKLVSEIFRRTLANPNEASLLEAHALLTELSRDPHVAALVNARLTGAVTRRLTGQRDSEED